MALARLTLDTRKTSKRKDGNFPIALRVHHKKTRFISLGFSTSVNGWDDRNGRLKKSASSNRFKNHKSIEEEINDKLHCAKKKIKNFEMTLIKLVLTN